jgi:hypothetical protein
MNCQSAWWQTSVVSESYVIMATSVLLGLAVLMARAPGMRCNMSRSGGG